MTGLNFRAKRTGRVIWQSFLLLALLVPLPAAGQQAGWRLSKVQFNELKKQNYEQMLTASGLKIGQEVDVEAFNAATKKLLATGVFKKVGYRYNYQGNNAVLIFEVEEAALANVPCVFDNLLWFSDQEIIAAVRRKIPEFDGTAPQGDLIIGQIKEVLQSLLKTKNIAGEVEYESNNNLSGTHPENVFRVKGVNLKVCEFQVAGANEKIKGKLLEAAKDLLGTEYSRMDTRGYVGAALIPVYRQNGYLKARFQPAQANFGTGGRCPNGVILTAPVEEGALYHWNRAEWMGAQAVSVSELDKMMNMKSGEVADAMKIDKGFFQVHSLYSKRGYMAARLKEELSLDDTQQLASYRIAIEEGPRYRMGKLTISGLSEGENKKLEEKWRLRTGDFYDGLYLDDFTSNLYKELGPQKITTLSVKTGVKSNRETQTVDVTVEFSERKK